jgi:hypothetical protein
VQAQCIMGCVRCGIRAGILLPTGVHILCKMLAKCLTGYTNASYRLSMSDGALRVRMYFALADSQSAVKNSQVLCPIKSRREWS